MKKNVEDLSSNATPNYAELHTIREQEIFIAELISAVKSLEQDIIILEKKNFDLEKKLTLTRYN